MYPSTMTTMTCSRKCSAIYSGQVRNTQVTKTCPVCGKAFSIVKCRSEQATCSKKCAGVLKSQLPDKKVTLTCEVCGKAFQVPLCRALTAKTCSNECAVIVRAKSRERKVKCICEHCGKVFDVPQSVAKRKVYCSRECQYASDKFRTEQRGRFLGNKNPMWKGGTIQHSGGYMCKHIPEHPFASNGYVFKHRLRIEEWLREEDPDSKYLIRMGDNLYLSPDYVVHHLDWNRKNNRRRNLIVCSSSVHGKIHNGTYPEPGTYWPDNAKIKLGKHLSHEQRIRFAR